MKTAQLSADSIAVPDYVDRPYDKVRDSHLLNSIQQTGIQQALVVIEHNGETLLVDGLRRLRIAKTIGLPKVPVVYDEVPKGADVNDHIRRLRFILDQHRQDLTPSQKASFIETLKEMFSMNHKQVAHYLGIAADSVTNWLAVKQYIDPVREAVDRGAITLHAARVFDGLTEKGQKAIWKAHESELRTEAGSAIHHRLRREYSPDKFPEFYRNPEQTKGRMTRKGAKRKANARPSITPAEKKRLLSSFEMKEIELRDGEEELSTLKRQINAAIAPIGAITRNPDLWRLVPDEMKPEFERFAEVYI